MRKLALCAYSFSAAALLSVLLGAGLWSVLTGAVLLILFGVAWFLRTKLPQQLLPLLLGLLLGILWCAAWNRLLLSDARQLGGCTETVEAEVLEYPVEAAYGEAVTVRVGKVNCRLYLDADSGLVPGQRIRVTARFALTAEKTGEDYYLSVGVPLFAYAKELPEVIGTAKHPWRFFPAKLGQRMRDQLTAAFDAETAPFLIAILTGSRTALRENTFLYAMLKESGVIHCIAVSGMHLSFLVTFLYVLLGRGKLSGLVCIPVILLFMAMTGFTASVVRAGVMQLSVCLGTLLKREYDNHSALALALFLLTAVNPYSLLNVGLQLSFAATLGILLFAGPLGTALRRNPKRKAKKPSEKLLSRLCAYVRNSLAVSLSAMIFTTPITVFAFGQFALLGPLSNLLILWAVSLCFGFGLFAALLGFLWPAGAVIIGYPARLLVRYLVFAVQLIGRLPFASLYPNGNLIGLWLILCYGLLLAYRFLPGLTHRLRGFACAALVLLLCLGGLGLLLTRQDALCAAVLDVGQGQCTVFMDRRNTIVADCGGSGSDNAGDLAARYLLSRGRTHIDALVLTHFHADHANGAIELMKRFPVGMLFLPPPEDGDEAAAAIVREAERQGVAVRVSAESISDWELGALRFTIVPPLGGIGDNEQGLCVLLQRGDFEMLVTGDASRETEQRLTERLELPDIELLAVGHHGSKTSTSAQLLRCTAPDTAVISVGRNSYGLPAAETMERLSEAGAAIYRTDHAGTVEIRISDQKGAYGYE